MTYNELRSALSAMGLSTTGNTAQLQARYDAAVAANNNAADTDAASDNTANAIPESVAKALEESGAFLMSSQEARELIRTTREREYPDFGRDIPEGSYITTEWANTHQWKNRRGNLSTIVTIYLQDENGNLYEIATGAFAEREYPFVSNGEQITLNAMFPYNQSRATRNEQVFALNPGTPVRVHHAFGHYDNPDAERVWNFTLTWVSAE